jgi:hypothetical protein
MNRAALSNLRSCFTKGLVKPMLRVLRSPNTVLYAASAELSNYDGIYGCVYTKPLNPKLTVIVVDITSNILQTVVHELLHVLYPHWSEHIVLKMQNLVVNTLSISESRRLLQAFTKHIRNK